MVIFCCTFRCLTKLPTVRAIRTASLSTQAHRLTTEGPYVRLFGNPNVDKLKCKEDDFLYFPNFFNDAEQEILLKLALWKLDRVDSSRRRRRRRTGTTESAEEAATGSNRLQRMFQSASAYGFEDVSWY